MKHFINKELLALNVMTFPVDLDIVAEFADPARLSGNYVTVSPAKWNSDIRWISAADEDTFSVFQSAFDRLGIAAHAAPYLDLDRDVRLYAGFLVVRSSCTGTNFHLDYIDANNEAFTLLTPVSSNAGNFGLLYKQVTGDFGDYNYKPGEAIAFGDNFLHSTKPGESEEPVILLCFEFGTDKMEHWPKIYPTVGYQLTHLRQPDGRFVRASGSPGLVD